MSVADPTPNGLPATTTVGAKLGGWMAVVSLWNEPSDPFGSNAERAAVVSVGPPSRCAAGYACGAGSVVETGSGTLHSARDRSGARGYWLPEDTVGQCSYYWGTRGTQGHMDERNLSQSFWALEAFGLYTEHEWYG